MPEFIRLSTRDYVRRETVDEVENTPVKYRGDLGEEQAITYTRQLNFWPWGTSGGSMSAGTISVDNRSGRYDQLIYRDLRDQRISIIVPTKGTPVTGSSDGTSTSGATSAADITVLTAIVDRIEAPNDREVLVHLKDMLTLLDVPIQNKVYGDDADDGVQERPLPILLGVARSIRPTAWEAEPVDEDGPAYRLHDAGLSGLTNVRDKGVVLSPFDSPFGFKLDNRIGNAGIILGAAPDGVVTVDASTSGDAIIPPTTDDALAGNMLFDAPFTDVEKTTAGGTVDTTTLDPIHVHMYKQGDTNPGLFSRTHSQYGDYAYLHGGFSQNARAIAYHKDKILEAGKTYRWKLTLVVPVTYYTSSGGVAISEGRFKLRAVTQHQNADRIGTYYGDDLLEITTLGANNNRGEYSGLYTVPSWGDHYVEIACISGGACGIKDIHFEEVPPPPPDELDGISLYDYAVEVVRRVGLPTSLIDKPSIDEVDPNEELIGFYADRPITALAVLRAPLNSFCADVFTDRDGVFQFARLRDPSVEVPDRQVDRNNIVQESDVLVYPDEGQGLTTSMTAAKHWYVFRDSDFAETGTGLTVEQKESLKREGRYIRTALLPQDDLQSGTGTSAIEDDLGSWPRLYRHAVNADPMVSLFDEAGAAAAEIQRVVDLYSQVRQFVEVDIWLDPGEFVELNEIVLFKYPRYQFDDGKNMIVVSVSDTVEASGARRIASLRLWG